MTIAGAAVAAPVASERKLLLEIWVNDRTRHVVAHVVERGTELMIERKALLDAGIAVGREGNDSDGFVSGGQLPGLALSVSERDQRLLVSAAPERIAPRIIDLAPGKAPPNEATAGTGVALNYDAVATAPGGGKSITAGAALFATGFAPWGLVTSSGFGTAGGGVNRFTRLDTTLEIDELRALRQWSFGDTISGGLAWSRPVRFAGLHVGTDYSLQPELVTLPLPQFFGQAVVPSTADVFVGAAKIAETQVDPGPFTVRNLPIVTGGGTARVVVRDELGRETTQTIPFYATNQMLAKGLFSYSLDVGALRRSYGVRSFDYGEAIAESNARYGLTDRLTIEAHTETAAGVVLAGGGAVFSLPPLGAIHAAGAASTSRRGEGRLLSIGAESQTKPLGLFASLTTTSETFSDVGAIGGKPPPKRRLQLGTNYGFDRLGSISVSWIAIDDRNFTKTKLATASYSMSLGGGLFFGLTGVEDASAHKWSTQAFLSIPLGGGASAGASTSHQKGSSRSELSLNQPTNPDGGFGYHVAASTGRGDILQADGSWIGRRGRLEGAISSVNGHVATRVGASGSIVAMDGSVFATRQSGDAFALVRTGAPNIEITHENRTVATSDAEGEAFVPGLNSYASNRIGVDPRDYSMATIVEKSQRIVVPRRRSGVIVDFTPKAGRPMRVVLHVDGGEFPPVGARVQMEGTDEPLVVGRRGQIFIRDLRAPTTGKVALKAKWCHFSIDPPTKVESDEIPEIGPINCTTEAADAR